MTNTEFSVRIATSQIVTLSSFQKPTRRTELR